MRVTVIEGGVSRPERGRSLESIARRVFGRDAEVRPEHSEVFAPEVAIWTATRTDHHGTHVLGKIVTGPRVNGRPRITDTRIIVGVRADTLADIDKAAADAGITRSEEARRRLARRVTAPRHDVTR